MPSFILIITISTPSLRTGHLFCIFLIKANDLQVSIWFPASPFLQSVFNTTNSCTERFTVTESSQIIQPTRFSHAVNDPVIEDSATAFCSKLTHRTTRDVFINFHSTKSGVIRTTCPQAAINRMGFQPFNRASLRFDIYQSFIMHQPARISTLPPHNSALLCIKSEQHNHFDPEGELILDDINGQYLKTVGEVSKRAFRQFI